MTVPISKEWEAIYSYEEFKAKTLFAIACPRTLYVTLIFRQDGDILHGIDLEPNGDGITYSADTSKTARHLEDLLGQGYYITRKVDDAVLDMWKRSLAVFPNV